MQRGPPLGGGGIRPRSATSSAVMSKPSGGIRSLPSLSAWGLPTPIVALACICDVDIRVFSGAGCQLYFYGVCKFICLSSFMYNRFHKELRFFFSLLKRKKEAKKEKSSHFTCATRSNITRRLHVAKIPRRGEQAAAAAVTLLFSQLKLGRRVSGDPPQSPGGANRRLPPP